MPAPTEPSSDIRQFTHFLKEMHTALLQEGFTEAQAQGILGQVVAAGFIANKE